MCTQLASAADNHNVKRKLAPCPSARAHVMMNGWASAALVPGPCHKNVMRTVGQGQEQSCPSAHLCQPPPPPGNAAAMHACPRHEDDTRPDSGLGGLSASTDSLLREQGPSGSSPAEPGAMTESQDLYVGEELAGASIHHVRMPALWGIAL